MSMIPIKNNKLTTLIFIIGAVILFIAFLLEAFGFLTKLFCQLLFLFEAVFYTYILNKFVLTEFTYVFDGENFKILKTIGKKNITECNIEKSKIVTIMPYKAYKKQEDFKIKSIYNYNANFLASSCYCLVFKYSDVYETIMFEPNEKFVELINAEICKRILTT